jgi:putative ABC transport system substrate-binding protein
MRLRGLSGARDELVSLAGAARDAVPTISGWRAFPVAGGLTSYGTDLADAYRQVGLYAGKILKGIRPGDLPVHRPGSSSKYT